MSNLLIPFLGKIRLAGRELRWKSERTWWLQIWIVAVHLQNLWHPGSSVSDWEFTKHCMCDFMIGLLIFFFLSFYFRILAWFWIVFFVGLSISVPISQVLALSRFLYLENVASILDSTPSMRKVMWFIIQDFREWCGPAWMSIPYIKPLLFLILIRSVEPAGCWSCGAQYLWPIAAFRLLASYPLLIDLNHVSLWAKCCEQSKAKSFAFFVVCLPVRPSVDGSSFWQWNLEQPCGRPHCCLWFSFDASFWHLHGSMTLISQASCSTEGYRKIWNWYCSCHLPAVSLRCWFKAWKDVDLKPLQQALPADWNPLNRQPLVSWLVAERTPEDSARIHALGNIVVPQQARMAFPILLRMFKERAMLWVHLAWKVQFSLLS